MRLNPYHPSLWHGYAAFPLLLLRRFDEAFAALDRAGPVPIVDLPAYTAVALAHQGRLDEARRHIERYGAGFRELITYGREPEPGEPARWILDLNPYRRQEDTDFLLEGLRQLSDAGVGLAALPSPSPAEIGDGRACFFRRDEVCCAAFAGKEVALPDLKGFVDIQRLLERPGEEVHCLDLAERRPSEHGGDPVLDDAARAALKARIRDLHEEIAEAEANNDLGRVERLRAEFERLVEILTGSLGLGGRSRRLGSLAERARTTVTWRIRHAVKRIEDVHPALGRHFARSLRPGTFCCYSPERPVTWRLAPEIAAGVAGPSTGRSMARPGSRHAAGPGRPQIGT